MGRGDGKKVTLTNDRNMFLSYYIQLFLDADLNNSCIRIIISHRENCDGPIVTVL